MSICLLQRMQVRGIYRRRADPEAFAQVRVDNEHHETPGVKRWVTT